MESTTQTIPETHSSNVDSQSPHLTSLLSFLHDVVSNKSKFKALLGLHGEQAQVALDVLQRVLETSFPMSLLRRSLIVATQRLERLSGRWPTALKVEGVRFEKAVIAYGASGDVHQGWYKGGRVAVKVLRKNEETDMVDFSKACSKEASVWSQLSHTNVLPFLGIGTVDQQHYFVSPWMDNGDLTSFVRKHPSVDKLLLLQDTAAGLAYLHSQEVVHGDLKGANVLVDGSGRAYLADFGLSSVVGLGVLHWSTQSCVGSRGGTWRWWAPETLGILLEDDGSHPLGVESNGNPLNTAQSDVYSWACLSYEVSTGKIPFYETKGDAPWLLSMCRDPTRRPRRPASGSEVWGTHGLTPSLWEFMTKCWEGDPSLRPSSLEIVDKMRTLVVQKDTRPPSNLKELHLGRSLPDCTLVAARQILEDLIFPKTSGLS